MERMTLIQSSGIIKTLLTVGNFELEMVEVDRIFTPREFFQFVSITQMRSLHKDIHLRKGTGILRRDFHWVLNKGVGSVQHRIPWGCWNQEVAFFESIGRPGFVGVRERSCHKCPASCVEVKFKDCLHSERCGSYRILELNRRALHPGCSHAAIERMLRSPFLSMLRRMLSLQSTTLLTVLRRSPYFVWLKTSYFMHQIIQLQLILQDT